MRAWRIVSIGGLGASFAMVTATSCESVVGFDGSSYGSIVDAMCGCPEMLQAFDSTATCKSYFTTGLARATAIETQAWLQNFTAKRCDLCTVTDISPKLACIDFPPVCLKSGEACTDPAECCGFAKGVTQCIPSPTGKGGACGTCRALGDACGSSAECCGFRKDSFTLPYCSPVTHVCVQRSPTCVKSGEPCTPGSGGDECCGAEGGMGSCVSGAGFVTDVCQEECIPDTPDNCPGCCASSSIGKRGGDCRDRAPLTCSSYCNPNGPESCPSGSTCQQACSGTSPGMVCTYRCM